MKQVSSIKKERAWYYIQSLTGNVVCVGTGDDTTDLKAVHKNLMRKWQKSLMYNQKHRQERKELNFIEYNAIQV